MTVFLHGLSTALPPHCLTQTEVRERAAIIFGGVYSQFDRLSRTFDSAGGLSRSAAMVPVAGVGASSQRFSMWPGFLG
ncbi:hypothetical protein [Roseivivax sp. CAU 1753]